MPQLVLCNLRWLHPRATDTTSSRLYIRLRLRLWLWWQWVSLLGDFCRLLLAAVSAPGPLAARGQFCKPALLCIGQEVCIQEPAAGFDGGSQAGAQVVR